MDKLWVGYVRLSTTEQAQTNALRNQEARVREAGATTVYTDVESGASSERSGLQAVLDLVLEGKVSRIIATRWDRLTRDSLMYEQLKTIFRDSNVELYLIDQGELVDLHTAAGELYSDLQILFGVHERRSLKERVKKGFQKKRDRGGAWAKAPVLPDLR